MSRIINISGLTPIEDPSYRYKMPTVVGKIEGRGNGIKTVIVNISELALSLHRDAGEVNKFFGCEMGAQTTFNEEDDRAVVNGAHSDMEMQQCVHKYIEKFVLCPNCGLPETTYSIKQGCIWHRCAACGAKEMVDMNHKLTTYILSQDKKNKKEKAKAKAEKAKEDKENGSEEDKKKKKKKDKGSDDEKKDKKSKKEKKAKKEKKSKKEKKEKGSGDSLAEDVDDLSIGSGGAVDDIGAMNIAVRGVQKYLKENPDASASDISELVINEQMASALKSHEKIQIFVRAVITPDFFKNKEIEKYAPVIVKITQKNPIMERHLIAAIEGLCADMGKIKLFPVMIKQLFDEEALQEDVILEWAVDEGSEYTLDSVDEDTKAKLRAEADPLVNWLEEESDSDSGDSDSDSD